MGTWSGYSIAFRFWPPTLLCRWAVSYWLAVLTVFLALIKDFEIWIPAATKSRPLIIVFSMLLLFLDMFKPILTIATIVFYRISILLHQWSGLEGLETLNERKERVELYARLVGPEINKTLRLQPLHYDEWLVDAVVDRYVGYVLKINGMKAMCRIVGLQRPVRFMAWLAKKQKSIVDLIKDDLIQCMISSDEHLEQTSNPDVPIPMQGSSSGLVDLNGGMNPNRDETVTVRTLTTHDGEIPIQLVVRKRSPQTEIRDSQIMPDMGESLLQTDKQSQSISPNAKLRRKMFAESRTKCVSPVIKDIGISEDMGHNKSTEGITKNAETEVDHNVIKERRHDTTDQLARNVEGSVSQNASVSHSATESVDHNSAESVGNSATESGLHTLTESTSHNEIETIGLPATEESHLSSPDAELENVEMTNDVTLNEAAEKGNTTKEDSKIYAAEGV